MIDLNAETVISLAEAASLLPRRRAGKKPHVCTMYRWISRGCRGVKLESIAVGATLCTSREALQRFCERLTTGGGPVANPTKRRQKEVNTAKAELSAAGY